MPRRLDHSRKQPRHAALAEDLLARIADGTYALGDRLPTENDLCERYGLARGTVRQHYTRGDRPSAELKAKFTADALAGYHIEQRVSAALIDAGQAAALGASAGMPALVLTRRITDRRGRLVNVGIYTHPAERYEIVTSLPE